MMQLETRQWAAIVGGETARIRRIAFVSEAKDLVHVLTIAPESYVDVYELW